MQYNIHPIIVHFPIAMLFLYSIIKVLPFKKWFPNVSWKHIEIVLLLVGVVSAFTASSTGEIAEELVRPNEDVLGAHQFFRIFRQQIKNKTCYRRRAIQRLG